MHERVNHDTSNCSIGRTLDVIGEKWTVLILREAWYGVTRFDDFHTILACPRNLLAKRLRKLVDAGVLQATPYKVPGSRSRTEYRLTPKGSDLIPTILGMLEWGNAYLADPQGPAVLVKHRDCGGDVKLEMRCTIDRKIVGIDELEDERGPSFKTRHHVEEPASVPRSGADPSSSVA